MTDPLVPSDVDLRDFAFMPLDVTRLFNSRFHAVSNDSEWRAGVTLWCKSWQQVPCGSLPDDDVELCRLAELGRDQKAWRKVRENALHGWVKCSDGRLYHPVVTEKAAEAWAKKRKASEKGRLGNEKRWGKPRAGDESATRQGDGEESQDPAGSDPQGIAQGFAEGLARGSHKDRKGQGQGQGQGLEEIPPPPVVGTRPPAEAPAPAAQLTLVDPPAAPPPGPYEPPDCPHQAVLSLWAEMLPTMPQHNPAMWRGTRADHLRARWRETADEKRWPDQAAGLAYLRKLFGYCAKSPFLMGRTPPQAGRRPFAFELEWLVAPTNWARVIEGKYHEEAA